MPQLFELQAGNCGDGLRVVFLESAFEIRKSRRPLPHLNLAGTVLEQTPRQAQQQRFLGARF